MIHAIHINGVDWGLLDVSKVVAAIPIGNVLDVVLDSGSVISYQDVPAKELAAAISEARGGALRIPIPREDR